jgi:hypothetical protein
MGGIFSMIKGSGPSSSDDLTASFTIDLSAQPNNQEIAIYQLLSDILGPSEKVLESLKTYTGCGDWIRKAISQPSQESEAAAWEQVSPAVMKLKNYYEFALSLEEAFMKVMDFLCRENLEGNQATLKKLADLLFVSSGFDDLKVSNPNIQNDFSYYRRTLSKMRMQNPNPSTQVVGDELANRMSLFYAHSTPCMKLLIDSCTNLTMKGVTIESISECLGALASLSALAIPQNPALVEVLLRVMVASIVLFDQVNPVGAFAKGSGINIRASARIIQSSNSPNIVGFMNTLRYSTKHLNDETTPKATKILFAT